jgi:hypothetical protein
VNGTRLAFLATCALVGTLFVPAPASYAVNGTHPCGVLESGYFLISTQAQLAEVGSGGLAVDEPCRLDANYRLMNDLTLAGKWVPLPGVPEFSGEFDGNGKTIRNMVITEGLAYTIDGSSYLFGGLFSRVKGADIHDLSFVDAEIDVESSVENYVGVLSGVANNPATGRNKISRIRVANSTVFSQNLNLWNFSGGLLGFAGKTDFDDITVERTQVSSDSDRFAAAGGVVGSLSDSNLTGVTIVCSDVGATSSDPNDYSAGAGGIAGEAYTSYLDDSQVFGEGTIRASSPGLTFAGGAFGGLFDGGVSYSGVYNVTVEVERGAHATDYETMAGGLVGWLGEAYVAYSLVKNTDVSSRHLGTSAVTKPQVGGLVGKSEIGFIDNNYIEAGSVAATLDSGTAERVGGLLGFQEGVNTPTPKNAVVEYSYVNNTVTPVGQEAIGRVGIRSVIDAVLFRDDLAGEATYPASPTFPLGLTGALMRTFSTYDGRGWFITEGAPDENNFWWGISPTINDGFPYLFWEVEDGFVVRDCSTGCEDNCGGSEENAGKGGQSWGTASASGSNSHLAATGPPSGAPLWGFGALIAGSVGFFLIVRSKRQSPSKRTSSSLCKAADS